ncbi:DUF4282 domain-containing protein [Thiomicrorhabdus sp. Milos-T2]|uniref:DUF4282 domain-containing protein n=1 Tax=Thiomicrorhabdus sp. Milos-T2 TaxID=90814 RepID=UPI00068DD713
MDFLTFKSFISIEVLITFYYLGAIILPFGTWLLMIWLFQKYELVNLAYKQGKETLLKTLNKRQKRNLIIFFLTSFLFMELFWRMLFEFLIAYMQIRDALLHSPM